jgi:hypothetical protein
MTFLDPKALKKSVFAGTKLFLNARFESEELKYREGRSPQIKGGGVPCSILGFSAAGKKIKVVRGAELQINTNTKQSRSTSRMKQKRKRLNHVC